MIEKIKEEILREFYSKWGKGERYAIYSYLGTRPEYEKVKEFISESIDTAYKAGQDDMRNKILEWADKYQCDYCNPSCNCYEFEKQLIKFLK